jgi:hypothetical protein
MTSLLIVGQMTAGEPGGWLTRKLLATFTSVRNRLGVQLAVCTTPNLSV